MNLFMRIQRKNCRICIVVHANKINSDRVFVARCAHIQTLFGTINLLVNVLYVTKDADVCMFCIQCVVHH